MAGPQPCPHAVMRAAARNSGGLGFGLGTGDIDAAFEVGAVVDADAGGLDIADHTALVADRQLLGYFDIAAHRSEDDYFARFDVGLDLAVLADGEHALRFQAALHFAIYKQFLIGANLSLDVHGG